MIFKGLEGYNIGLGVSSFYFDFDFYYLVQCIVKVEMCFVVGIDSFK